MKVKELKEQLKGLPGNMEIILQNSNGRNGYSPLFGIESNAVYVPKNLYYGTAYNTNWSANEACVNEKEWEKIKSLPRCLIMYGETA
jgi:hypothetical protein